MGLRGNVVVILTSGQMIVVMIDAGTTIPPIPRPATTRIPHNLSKLSTSATDMAPQPNRLSVCPLQRTWISRIHLPAVIRTLLAIINSRLWPLNTVKSQSTTQAPAMIANPAGIPRTPTPTGSWPYTLKACVGQNIIREKKFAPEINVMIRVRTSVRFSCCRRRGKIGNSAK